MGKLNIDFVLLDEGVVDYGYRCLMSGAELDEFKANPIMLLMHLRATEWYNDRPDSDPLLPLGKWYDIRIEGHQLLAKPEFDDDDELAMKVQRKVEKGYLNAASVWVLPIAVSDDEDLKIQGQSSVTITKWGVKECSIVDIPGCRNAIAIRDADGKLLKLSSNDKTGVNDVNNFLHSLLPNQNSTTMDKKLLAAKLGLPDTATDTEVSEKLTSVLSAASTNTKLTADNQQLKDEVATLKAAQATEKVNKLVDDAIQVGKLSAADRDEYIDLATSNFDTTKKLIDKMKPYESIEGKLSSGSLKDTDALELNELLKLSGTDLWKQGKLARLQELSEPHFKLKYKEAFGVEYKA